MKNEGCKYCDNLRITDGDCNNIALVYGDTIVLGNEIRLSIDISKKHLCLNGTDYDNIITKEINYCPMCGRKF